MTDRKNELKRLCQSGRFSEARALCESLCSNRPDDPELWYLAGAIHGAMGQFDEAEKCCRKALAFKPNQSALHHNLGIALLRQGRASEAEHALLRAHELQPGNPDVLTGLADSVLRQGKFETAIRHYRDSLAIAPRQPQALHNLALAYQQMGQFGEADACFQQATAFAPKGDTAYLEWSRMLLDRGDLTGALSVLEKGLAISPASGDLRYQLGYALFEAGRREEALHNFELCLATSPGHVEARFARAMIRRYTGRISDAAEDLHFLLRHNDNDARAHTGLAGLCKDEGQIEEMLFHDRRAVAIDPQNGEYQSNLLMDLHYSDRIPPQELFDAHRTWGMTRYSTVQARTRHANEPDPKRRLRIGYVSQDFKQHSVAQFIEAVLAHRNREQQTVFLYSNLRPEQSDVTTRRLRELTDLWRDIVTLSDHDAATLVAADGIDILVDLAGHTAGNRLGIFAHRPAPLQISWIGYPDTTGLAAMDYRLTDQWADPEGDADARSIEKLLRMPGGFLCFAPPRDAPDPGTLPYDNTGVITFGSLNNLAKVNDGVVAVWAEILASVPRSRLVLKGTALADTYVRERVALRFDKHGIAPDRLDLMAWTASTEAHLGYYRKIDIALDTFPYNGTTTTCEALWMGVPVITLCGEVHAARVGLSLLNQVGMMEFVATTPDAYVAHAITLARDLPRLRELRSGLRARVKQAPLTDAPGFDARLQECYRHAWRQWCERQRLTDRQR